MDMNGVSGVNMEMQIINDIHITEKVNPFDPLVRAIEEKGMSLEDAFNLFDGNGDQILTLQELR